MQIKKSGTVKMEETETMKIWISFEDAVAYLQPRYREEMNFSRLLPRCSKRIKFRRNKDIAQGFSKHIEEL